MAKIYVESYAIIVAIWIVLFVLAVHVRNENESFPTKCSEGKLFFRTLGVFS